MTGEEVAELSDAALAARVEEIDLYARISPDQKTRIVLALRQRGHTVGFLGDGVNDAPAIHAADVGLSVEGATDVAREAADMIMLVRNLDVVADGVRGGPAHVRQYPEIRAHGNELELRQHAVDGAGVDLPAVLAADRRSRFCSII